MQKYEIAVDNLETNRIYSHKELLEILRGSSPNLTDSSYHWIISCWVRDGRLFRNGYDAYSLPSDVSFKEYIPHYSNEAQKLIEDIANSYPYVAFTVFETVLMNDFLNHLVAQNTIFLQVEKESSIYVFRHLQDEEYSNILYKPNRKDMVLYWNKGSVIVTDMVSEAPIRTSEPHVITLEKMLVDMLADKLISSTYSKAEYSSVIEQVESSYLLDKKRMLRYARRRNKYDEIRRFLEGGKENAGS